MWESLCDAMRNRPSQLATLRMRWKIIRGPDNCSGQVSFSRILIDFLESPVVLAAWYIKKQQKPLRRDLASLEGGCVSVFPSSASRSGGRSRPLQVKTSIVLRASVDACFLSRQTSLH